MSGTYFKLNADDITKAINKGVEQIGNTKDLMNAIGETLVSSTKERFDEGVASDGSRWVKGRKPKGNTLMDRGTLRKSITCNADIAEVSYGSNLEYGAIHQFGGEIKPKKGKSLKFMGADGKWVFVKKVTIPARPFIGISKEDEAEIKEIMALHMKAAFK